MVWCLWLIYYLLNVCLMVDRLSLGIKLSCFISVFYLLCLLVAETLSSCASLAGGALGAWIASNVDRQSLDITWVGEVADDILDVEIAGDLVGDLACPFLAVVGEGATDFPGVSPDDLGVGGGFTVGDGGTEVELGDPVTVDAILSGDPVSGGGLPLWNLWECVG